MEDSQEILQAEVVILAGGFGTRMSNLFPDIPKPLVPVNGSPVIFSLLANCSEYGFKNVLLLLHHGAEQIIKAVGDGSLWGLNVQYKLEHTPLGTAGALLDSLDQLADTFLVMYADVYSRVDLRELVNFHNVNNCAMTLVAHPNNHPHDSDLLRISEDGEVLSVLAHPHPSQLLARNVVNAAMCVCNKKLVGADADKGGKGGEMKNVTIDIAQDLVPRLLGEGKKIVAYKTVEYLKDMGTPDRLRKVEMELNTGVAQARDKECIKKAIFVDRDGTLNHDVGYMTRAEDLLLIEGAGQAIKKINQSPYLAICVTNQPVLARGDATFDDIDRIHCKLDMDLGYTGAYLDELIFCPHHPDSGFVGEVPELKIECGCRKPAVGMVETAAGKYNISLTRSWMIGDRTADLQLAKNSMMRSVLLKTGDAGGDGAYHVRPTLVAGNVDSAVDLILAMGELFDDFFNVNESLLFSQKFIVITGLSRSGKTSLAGMLKHRLECGGKNAHVIELDRFLNPSRLPSSVGLGGYNTKAASDFIKRIVSDERGEFLDMGMNDTNTKFINYASEEINSESIFILEGTVAHEFVDLLPVKPVTIECKVVEQERRKRFNSKYEKKGISMNEINRLWALREANEIIAIGEDLISEALIFSQGEV